MTRTCGSGGGSSGTVAVGGCVADTGFLLCSPGCVVTVGAVSPGVGAAEGAIAVCCNVCCKTCRLDRVLVGGQSGGVYCVPVLTVSDFTDSVVVVPFTVAVVSEVEG